jgi:hypothetical protein
MTPTQNTPYPSDQQRLLLQAALLGREKGVQAWEHWRTGWNPEAHLDHGSFRTLPMLYRNLARMKVTDPELMRLKGIYRQSWVKNVSLFHETKALLLLLQQHHIPTMLLKGAALTTLYYKDSGTRPMADIDVMIPKDQARQCIDILHNAGWKAEFEAYLEYNLRYGRSMMFRKEDGIEADIHWFPLFESLGEGNSEDFWAHAVPISFSEIPVLALCAADNLLHVLIHGLKWNPEPPIRWVADAMMILQSTENPIDWSRFLELVKRFKVVLQIRGALQYLVQHFDAPVPPEVLLELSWMPVRISERLIYRHDQRNPDMLPDGFFGKINLLFIEYIRHSDQKGVFRLSIGFLRFLRFRVRGKEHARIMWYYMTRKARERGSRKK